MNSYLSKENLNHLFNNLSQDIINDGININENPKYRKALKKLMKAIDAQCSISERTYTVNQMNDITILKVKPFIIDLYNKEQSNKNKEIKTNISGFEVAGYLDNDYDNLSLSITDKPENSNINPLDALFQNSLITDKQKVKAENVIDTIDFQQRLSEVSKERGYENDNNDTEFQTGNKRLADFQKSIEQTNLQQQKELEKTLKRKNQNNEVFKNMSSNKLSLDNRLDFQDTSNPIKAKLLEAKRERDGGPISKSEFEIPNYSAENAQPLESDPNKTLDSMLERFNKNLENLPKMYENTQQIHERSKRHRVIIDTGKFSSALVTNIGTDTTKGWYKWKADLDIDLKVEGLSDIYLESVTITGHTSNDNCAYFVFDIDKFDIDANSNNSFLRDKIVVPNTTESSLYDTSFTFDGAVAATSNSTEVLTDSVITDIIVGDGIYLANGNFVGNVTAVGTSSDNHITLDAINTAIVNNAKLFVRKVVMKSERFDADANFVGTTNAKKLGVLEFTLTNENGESAEDGNNKVFTIDNLSTNRVILEFSIVTRK